MDPLFIAGIAVTLCSIVGLSIYSGRRQKAKTGGNPMHVVAGLIIGTLVGGSSTVGTAQLAFTYGMSAWWFTLGGGIACLILAFVYVKPLRRNGNPTLVGMITKEYGELSGMAASILSSIGMFLSIISQLISATAVIAVVLPDMKILTAVMISAVFMVLYVIFGGTKGAGIVGILKLLLLYAAMIGSGILVLNLTGGISGFLSLVNSIDNPEKVRFFHLFARGAGKDIGAFLSLLFGVLTTQTYAQAVLTAASDREAAGGAIASAVLIPPIGIGGILVGLYMKATAPEIAAKTALTVFVSRHVSALPAGIILGTLFVAVVGTGAGLALGISTIAKNDIARRFAPKYSQGARGDLFSKIVIVAVLFAAGLMSTGKLGDIILNFSFMSMGLRGAVVFAPLCGALWLKGRIASKYALAAIIAGPLFVFVFKILIPVSFDPLFAGMTAALMIMGLGLVRFEKSTV